MTFATTHAKKLGLGVFLFFFAKGLVWIGLATAAAMATL